RLVGGGMVRSVRAATWVLDETRPTEGSYAAFLEFENGAVAQLMYSGYDHLNSTEIAAGRGPKAPEEYGAIRRALRAVHTSDEEVALRISTGYGGERPITRERPARESLLQPE